MSDGFYEALGCGVIHFPFQQFAVCGIPFVFNPHDLQHLHYPQFFTPAAIAQREATWPVACRLASTVVVASNWIKNDLVRHYAVSPDKVQVIPWAPPTQTHAEPSPDQLKAVQDRYGLPQQFALYPAMTWEHKNHLRLLEAMALLRERDHLTLPLVCTGNRYPGFWPRIAQRQQELRLEEQVQFLGNIPMADLRAIYQLATAVVVPTLFEAASGPMFEAWQEGVPVACSTVTSLPEQAGGAALLFDPFSTDAIAKALLDLWTNPALRADLILRGRNRLSDFSWNRTARAYRAVYRRCAKLPLSPEDLELLSWDWMQHSNGKLEA